MDRLAGLQDEGWRPSITVKNILTGIQVQRPPCQCTSPSLSAHSVLQVAPRPAWDTAVDSPLFWSYSCAHHISQSVCQSFHGRAAPS